MPAAPTRFGVVGGGGSRPVGSPIAPGFRGDRSLDLAGSETEGKKTLQRTEFIVLFVWKEPTPSDALLPQEGGTESTEAPADTGGGGGGRPTGSAIPDLPPPPRVPGGKSS